MIKDTSNDGKLSEAHIIEMAKEHGIHVYFPPHPQKSMDDDNPTIPVNRGAAGVYIPEPNDKERAKKDLFSAATKYIQVSGDEMLVEKIIVDGKVYLVELTYEYPAE